MDDKSLNKEISEENPGASRDLRHTTKSLQYTTFHLFKPHVLSAIENIREKKKCPDVDSIFNHVTKGSAANIERDLVESILIELINQKIIPNKKTSSGCDSFYSSDKSANNSGILENSKNQVNLDASQISLKDPVLPVNVETPQLKHVIQNKNKPEEEINTLKLEAQISALRSYMKCELSAMNYKCLLKSASCQSNNENKTFETLQDNVKFLQKEFAAKNDLIRSLIETQTAILEFV